MLKKVVGAIATLSFMIGTLGMGYPHESESQQENAVSGILRSSHESDVRRNTFFRHRQYQEYRQQGARKHCKIC